MTPDDPKPPTVEEALERLAGRRATAIEAEARAVYVKKTIGQCRKTRRNNLRIERARANAAKRAMVSTRGVVTVPLTNYGVSIYDGLDDVADEMRYVTTIGSEGYVRDATPDEVLRHRANENTAADLARALHDERHMVLTKPGDPGGYRGEYDCGDCCSMTHCETHHKDEGTYPFDLDDGSLDRRVRTSQTAIGPIKGGR